MADDSDTEVVINQHDEESERDFTERDELGQGDIYSQQKEGQEPYMLRSHEDCGPEVHPMSIGNYRETSFPKKAGLPVKPEPYSGSEDWEEYISHFTLCSELGKWSEQERVLALAASLRGPARTFYISLSKEEKYNFTTLVRELGQRFGSSRQQSRWLSRLEGRKRKQDESIASLGDDLRQMSQRAHPNLDARAQEALALNQLYKSISLEMKCRCIDRNCSTIAQAVDIIERYESILGDGAERRRAVRMVGTDSKEPEDDISKTLHNIMTRLEQLERRPSPRYNQMRRNGQENNQCFGCGSSMHFIKQCPIARTKPAKQGGAYGQAGQKSGNFHPPSH